MSKESRVPKQSYRLRFWRGLDRWLNAITGGDDEETISHRVARAWVRQRWWGWAMCRFLDLFDRGHCRTVLDRPNPSDATVPLEAPLSGDANQEASHPEAP
jgi:hypothetical protein